MSNDAPFHSFPRFEKRSEAAPTPLQGITIIDFTRYLAGPWCTQALADMGAEIVKIESVEGGDETRNYRPPDINGISPYFIGLNRSKKSLSLNLSSKGGVRIVEDLVKRADVVVENFSPGVMRRLGIDYDGLKLISPDLIYCAITAYGSEGSYADQPGFDSVIQAESGFLSLTGEPDGQPMRTGSPVIDIATSMNATSAILGALIARQRDGKGQYVEVAMFDTAVSLLGYQPMNYLADGVDPVRQGNEAPVATPIGMFEAADGDLIYVSCGSQRSWEMLAKGVIERPDLIADSRFLDNRSRNRHRKELTSILVGIFLSRSRDDWMQRARQARVPIGAVRSVGEALNSPLSRERKLISRVECGDGNEMPNIASPFRFSRTPVADPVPAPQLNAHFEDILIEMLGYDKQVLADLDSLGAFSARKPK